ncbi:hypothetical protein MtrunA17_Chr4g0050871 [Medicago truncatula]|uniref:Retrotransposon gag domain-containing protein n=1 Tax=Medicago truncatula TaxID=3880 RepID=A0A396ID83_MEDTR|nr:hypothetical protein MtrunA17_Chr4g0050871 [Medicago truncatula]
MPKSLEKPLKLESYDGIRDPAVHIEHVDTINLSRGGGGGVKCKLFVLALKIAMMTWFTGLKDKSINLWKTMCEEFTSHFTTRESTKH